MEDIVTVFEKYSLPQGRSGKSIGWCPLGFESGCWSRRAARVEVEGGSCDWAPGWVEEGVCAQRRSERSEQWRLG